MTDWYPHVTHHGCRRLHGISRSDMRQVLGSCRQWQPLRALGCKYMSKRRLIGVSGMVVVEHALYSITCSHLAVA